MTSLGMGLGTVLNLVSELAGGETNESGMLTMTGLGGKAKDLSKGAWNAAKDQIGLTGDDNKPTWQRMAMQGLLATKGQNLAQSPQYGGPPSMPQQGGYGRAGMDRAMGRQRPGRTSLTQQIGRPATFDAGYFQTGGMFQMPWDIPEEQLDETGHALVQMRLLPGETAEVTPPGGVPGGIPGLPSGEGVPGRMGTTKQIMGRERADFIERYARRPAEGSQWQAIGAALFSDNPLGAYDYYRQRGNEAERERVGTQAQIEAYQEALRNDGTISRAEAQDLKAISNAYGLASNVAMPQRETRTSQVRGPNGDYFERTEVLNETGTGWEPLTDYIPQPNPHEDQQTWLERERERSGEYHRRAFLSMPDDQVELMVEMAQWDPGMRQQLEFYRDMFEGEGLQQYYTKIGMPLGGGVGGGGYVSSGQGLPGGGSPAAPPGPGGRQDEAALNQMAAQGGGGGGRSGAIPAGAGVISPPPGAASQLRGPAVPPDSRVQGEGAQRSSYDARQMPGQRAIRGVMDAISTLGERASTVGERAPIVAQEMAGVGFPDMPDVSGAAQGLAQRIGGTSSDLAGRTAKIAARARWRAMSEVEKRKYGTFEQYLSERLAMRNTPGGTLVAASE